VHGVADAQAIELQAAPPGTYWQRFASSLQTLFHNHFPEFCARYQVDCMCRPGHSRQQRITKAVERFLECGDCTKPQLPAWVGVARIRCTNSDCRPEYFRPFSCKAFHLCPCCADGK
jgi:hypothetical protein